MKKTIFIDGQHGTTGLKIHERLKNRADITIVEIPMEKKKDPAEKKKFLNESDIVFLCLPDDAARESVAMVNNPNACVIDASTAHRTAQGWVYGLPELNKAQRGLIRSSSRICVPGCHATGYVLVLYPLIASGIVPSDYPVSAFSISGYSGGGRSMIAEYAAPDLSDDMKNPRPYGLKLNHKHVPEMQKIPGLAHPPIFFPTVANFFNGEVISIPFYKRLMSKKMSSQDIFAFYQEYYAGERFVKIMPYPTDPVLKNGFLTLTQCNDTNMVEIFVFGDDEKMVLTARFDNLGKGSSGAAVQNMNIKIGADENAGLV
jgi:N-acetyl-gamma-glutamyl-phosphate reductase